MARADMVPAAGRHDGRHRRPDPGRAGQVLDLGGHPATRREGRGGRCTQLSVLLLGIGCPQPGQHRPRHRGQRRRHAGGRAHRTRRARRDPTVHRHVVHVSIRGPGRSAARPGHRMRTPVPTARPTSCCATRSGRPCPCRSPTSSRRCGTQRRSAASSFMATTRGGSAWRTRWPPSTPVRSWSTVRSVASAVARSRQAQAATPRPRTCCSRCGRTGSTRTRCPRWSTPRRVCSPSVDEPNRSRTIQGARSKAAAFEWVLN